ncbi:uncharacterized protein LOC129217336 [Uloborus diversus]|uniref:uncharacterized protein LOC129217336 n=1 Tax=Uloborus diversus TaxID=327109 RepID=UPI002409EBDF|nr:uncharacterized protein LOC129217336 [Uloborus diversus]
MEVYNSLIEHMVHNLSRTEKPSFRVNDLSPGTSYVLVIYSSNIKGKSNSVALVAATPLPAEKRTAQDSQSSMSPIIIIMIGVVAIFVVLALVILFIIKTQLSQQRDSKDNPLPDSTLGCDVPKKELEESQDASEKGPDIIPLSIEAEVFFTGRIADDALYCDKPDTSRSEYVRQKYTDTVL